MAAIFIRERKPRKRSEEGIIPDSFYERFGHDTAIVTSDRPGEYLATTFEQLGRKKRERQAEHLRRKRERFGTTERRAIYVWVFHCPGIGGFAYEGWWTYLIGRNGWERGKYLRDDEKTIRQLMELFPLGESTLCGPALTHREWQLRFVKASCCRNANGKPRKHAGRIQGKALLWAQFDGDHLDHIIGRAYLPKITNPPPADKS